MEPTLQKKKQDISKCKKDVLTIIEELKDDDIKKKLNTICKLETLPDFSGDDEIKEMKDYVELKKIFKELYRETARAIMYVLNDEGNYSSDPKTSYNYTDPMEQMLAAECIKLLPNAFIGGPLKAAFNSPHKKVRTIAIDYFDSLSPDFKYSGIFAPEYMRKIRGKI